MSEQEIFISANAGPAEYEAWSRDERLKYRIEAEKINARWIEKKMQELRAAWIMVINGKVVARGSLTADPSDTGAIGVYFDLDGSLYKIPCLS